MDLQGLDSKKFVTVSPTDWTGLVIPHSCWVHLLLPGLVHLLLPLNTSLFDVSVTREFVETHLVLLQPAQTAGAPRRFTALNGLCGAVHADGAVTVHGRLRRVHESDGALGSVGGWDQRGRHGGADVPQLESQIVVLRESVLPPSARLLPR